MATNLSHEDRFYQNLTELTDFLIDLIQYCHDNGINVIQPSFLAMAKTMMGTYEKSYLIESFVAHTYEFWDHIRNRNVDFFLQSGASLFKSLPFGDVNLIKIFYTAVDEQGHMLVDEEDRESLWSYFSALIKISIKYIHEKRQPFLKQTAEGIEPSYRTIFMKQVKVREQAKNWEIKLPGLEEF